MASWDARRNSSGRWVVVEVQHDHGYRSKAEAQHQADRMNATPSTLNTRRQKAQARAAYREALARRKHEARRRRPR